MAVQIPSSPFVITFPGLAVASSPVTVTSVAFGASSRTVTVRSGFTSGDTTTGPVGSATAAAALGRGLLSRETDGHRE